MHIIATIQLGTVPITEQMTLEVRNLINLLQTALVIFATATLAAMQACSNYGSAQLPETRVQEIDYLGSFGFVMWNVTSDGERELEFAAFVELSSREVFGKSWRPGVLVVRMESDVIRISYKKGDILWVDSEGVTTEFAQQMSRADLDVLVAKSGGYRHEIQSVDQLLALLEELKSESHTIAN